MRRVIGYVIVAMVCVWLGISNGLADPPPQQGAFRPISINDLEPKLDGNEVAIKFTITGVDGITQRVNEEQAPSFVIEADSGKHKNRLSVWVEGELANVLDRLQMSAFQENQLKVGTTVVAAGQVRVDKLDSHVYLLSVTKWKNFRILPSEEKK